MAAGFFSLPRRLLLELTLNYLFQIPVMNNESISLVAQMIWNLILGIGLLVLGIRQRRLERAEDEVKKSAEALVDTRINSVEQKLDARLENVLQMLDEVKQRLSRGDDEFRNLDRADGDVKVMLAHTVADIKDFVRANCASKADVVSLTDKVDDVRVECAQCYAKMNTKGGNYAGE